MGVCWCDKNVIQVKIQGNETNRNHSHFWAERYQITQRQTSDNYEIPRQLWRFKYRLEVFEKPCKIQSFTGVEDFTINTPSCEDVKWHFTSTINSNNNVICLWLLIKMAFFISPPGSGFNLWFLLLVGVVVLILVVTVLLIAKWKYIKLRWLKPQFKDSFSLEHNKVLVRTIITCIYEWTDTIIC